MSRQTMALAGCCPGSISAGLACHTGGSPAPPILFRYSLGLKNLGAYSLRCKYAQVYIRWTDLSICTKVKDPLVYQAQTIQQVGGGWERIQLWPSHPIPGYQHSIRQSQAIQTSWSVTTEMELKLNNMSRVVGLISSRTWTLLIYSNCVGGNPSAPG